MDITPEERAWVKAEVMRQFPQQPNELKLCKESRNRIRKVRDNCRDHLIKQIINKKNSMNRNIAGVNVVIDHADIKAARSIRELMKLEIFSSLPKDKQDAAYKELFDEVAPLRKNTRSDANDSNVSG